MLGFQSLSVNPEPSALGILLFRCADRTRSPSLHELNAARHADVRSAARQNHVPGRVSTHRARTVSLAQQITLALRLLYRLDDRPSTHNLNTPHTNIPETMNKPRTSHPRDNFFPIFLVLAGIIVLSGCNGFEFESGMFNFKVNNHYHPEEPKHDTNATHRIE